MISPVHKDLNDMETFLLLGVGAEEAGCNSGTHCVHKFVGSTRMVDNKHGNTP
jgi:hypothetical protein